VTRFSGDVLEDGGHTKSASAQKLTQMQKGAAQLPGELRVFRVFLSSPADVQPEREAAERVVHRLGGIYAEHVELRLERWEPKFYEATHSFQEQIESTAAFNLVVAIFWKRIGTELPPNIYRRPDGSRFESGTVLEVESALEASVQQGQPALFVFRKTAAVMFSKENVEQEKRQSDLLDAWWTRTFRDAAGHFQRAFEGFAATHDFEDRFEDLLVEQLEKSGVIPKGPVWDIATQGSPYPGLQPYDSDRRSVFFGRALAIRDARDELLALSAHVPPRKSLISELSGPRFEGTDHRGARDAPSHPRIPYAPLCPPCHPMPRKISIRADAPTSKTLLAFTTAPRRP
jgi:hypothetical protein